MVVEKKEGERSQAVQCTFQGRRQSRQSKFGQLFSILPGKNNAIVEAYPRGSCHAACNSHKKVRVVTPPLSRNT
jgi:hypothetical protein